MFEAYWNAILLGATQGLTEFLPISSTAHLQLLQALGYSMDNQIAMDAWLHLGTLLAIVLYYHKTLFSLAFSTLRHPFSFHNKDTKEAYLLVCATLPAVFFGLFFKDLIEEAFTNVSFIAINSIVFALLLGIAFFYNRRQSNLKEAFHWTFKLALIVGIAQAMALIPGTSRSGITLTTALFLGFHPLEAARFSFLMSIPVTLGAIVLTAITHPQEFGIGVLGPYVVGALVAFGVALVCISLFLRFLLYFGVTPFVVYRIALGVGTLLFIQWGFL